MKALILTLALSISACSLAYSQGRKSIVIGTMIDKPNAILVINPPNSDQGFLLPQLTTTQRLSINPTSPNDDGLMVYDITDKAFYYWGGNAWIKGLGTSDSQLLSYDATNQQLSLSNGGGVVNLNTLKEIPTPTGNAGKFLTTDGTTLSWATLGSLGDITSIVAGQGLTGGGTTGDINLSLNTDGSTIGFTATDQLQLLDNAVTPTKIASPGADKVLTTNGTGVVNWEDRSSLISTPTISVDGTTIVGNGTVGTPLAVNVIKPANIESAGASKILVTDGAGVVNWSDQSAIISDDQDLSFAGHTLSIDNGTPADISAAGQVSGLLDNLVIANDAVGALQLADASVDANAIQTGVVNSNHIAANAVQASELDDNSVDAAAIQANAVTLSKIVPGANNQVLVTDNLGAVQWVNQSSFIPTISVDGTTITGDGIGTPLAVGNIAGSNIVDGSVQSIDIENSTIQTADIADGAVDVNKLATDAVNSVKIIDESITGSDVLNGSLQPIDLSPGSNNQVLVTDGVGSVQWVNQSSIIPAINVDGATIVGNGSGVPLAVGMIDGGKIIDESLTSNDILDGTIGTAEIAGNAINASKILDASITGADVLDGSLPPAELVPGANNQVLVTDGVGSVQWVNQSSIIPAITVDGTTITGNGAGLPLAVGTIDGLKITDGSISTNDIQDATIATIDIANNAVDLSKLADGAVNSNKIVDESITSADVQDGSLQPAELVPGTNNQVLVTDGVGSVQWINQSSLIPAITVDGTTITGDGAGTPLAVGTIDGLQITDGSISTNDIQDATIATIDLANNAVDLSKLADGAVNSNKIVDESITSADIQNGSLQPGELVPGANNQVLITDGVGSVQWVNQSSLIPAITVDGTTITGDGAGIPLAVGTIDGLKITDGSISTNDIQDATIATIDLANNAVDLSKLADGAVNSNKIVDESITGADVQNGSLQPGELVPGANNQVLVTDGVGSVQWVNQSSLIPAITVDGTTITGDGAGTPLAVGTIDGLKITDGSISTNDIQDATIATIDLANNAVDLSKLADGAVNSNKIVDESITSADVQNGSLQPGELVPGTNNQVLVTDGVGSVQWVNQTAIIPAITVDGTTITGNGAGTPLAVGSIDGSKIADETVTTTDILNGTIATADLADDAVDANKLADNAVSSNHITDGTVASIDIANGTIANADLAAGSVDTGNIISGGNGKVLTTDGSGVVNWIDRATFTDAQTLSLSAANALSISGGNSVDLNDINATGPQIQGTIDALAIVDGTVTTNDIQDGTITTLDLGDDAVDGNKLADNAVSSNHIVDGTVTGADILDATIASIDIANGTIANADLGAGSVDTGNIISGGNSKVLTTDVSGVVSWSDRTTFTDAQTISLSAANILSISGGNTADLNDINATGPQIQGTIDALAIVDETVTTNDILNGTIANADLANDAVNSAKILDNTVTSSDVLDGTILSADISDNTITSADILDETIASNDILDGSIAAADLGANSVTNAKILNKAVDVTKIQQGTANQLMATDGTGTNATWIDRGTLPSAGDVTGTLAATTVAKIQGRDVAATAPANGQALVWNNTTTTWEPGNAVVAATTQYYSIDPSQFAALQSGTTNNNMLGLFESNDSFVVPLNSARELIAPVTLPHGAVITNLTAIYVDNDIAVMHFALERKPFTTAAVEIAAFNTGLLSLVVTSTSFIGGTLAERTVDNSQYTYRIHVTFNGLLDVNTAGLALSRVHGFLITYTK